MAEATKYGLLSAVAHLMKPQDEDVATEGLCYILGSSKEVRTEFASILAEATGLSFEGGLKWRSQPGGPDNARPDLEGTDPEGRTRVIIEAKFWAELTPNQPSTYLKRLLKEDLRGAVVVIAPERRMETLWVGLRAACDGSLELGEDRPSPPVTKMAEIIRGHRLSLISWRAVIERLLRAAETAQEPDAAADLRQLKGLTTRIDSDAFLPLRQEELSDRIPVRVGEYTGLIDSALDSLVKEEAGVKKLRRPPGYLGWHVLLAGSLRGTLTVNFGLWSKYGWTPIWLELGDPYTKPPRAAADVLKPLASKEPCAFYEGDWGPVIPIFLPVGIERPIVVTEMVVQLRDVVCLLKRLPLAVLGVPIPEKEGEGTEEPEPKDPKSASS